MSEISRTFDPDDEPEDARGGRRGSRRKKPRRKRVTAALVEMWATRHLERYASSSQNLRQVLARRVERIEFRQEERFEEADAWIDLAVARMQERGYLDDRRYARTLCERFRARGASSRRIASELRQKGIPGDLAHELLTQGDPNAELEAAVRYARRRRLGPFRRDPEAATQHRERDLAALGRSGFSYETARQVVEATDPDTLENAANA
ncbi:MAG: RecX family transcriptional regulator [Myxococcota bacterium]|nr:RecX family transcriptional regulator [Myxococcota bacterium]